MSDKNYSLPPSNNFEWPEDNFFSNIENIEKTPQVISINNEAEKKIGKLFNEFVKETDSSNFNNIYHKLKNALIHKNTNEHGQSFASRLANDIQMKNPGMDPAQILKVVEGFTKVILQGPEAMHQYLSELSHEDLHSLLHAIHFSLEEIEKMTANRVAQAHEEEHAEKSEKEEKRTELNPTKESEKEALRAERRREEIEERNDQLAEMLEDTLQQLDKLWVGKKLETDKEYKDGLREILKVFIARFLEFTRRQEIDAPVDRIGIVEAISLNAINRPFLNPNASLQSRSVTHQKEEAPSKPSVQG